MSFETTQPNLSTGPRDDGDRWSAQESLDSPGFSIPVLGWDLTTAVAAATAAVLAIVVGLWLGGRGRKRHVPSILPAPNRAEVAVEMLPIAAKLLQSPAIRAYVLRMLIQSLTRKVTG